MIRYIAIGVLVLALLGLGALVLLSPKAPTTTPPPAALTETPGVDLTAAMAACVANGGSFEVTTAGAVCRPATSPVTESPSVPTLVSVPPTPAPAAAVFFDQLYLWSNGAPHQGLPTGPNGSDVSWLVHGDFGESFPGCSYKVLSNTSEIASIYPGTFRVVGIQGGSYADRHAVAMDRVANIGTPCNELGGNPTSAISVPAPAAAVFFDQLYLWSNGAPHQGLPTGPNGSDVSWLVHGDFGESFPGCSYKVLSNTSEIASIYPGTFRVVGIQGGSYADRLAVVADRMANYGLPCTQR